MILKRTSIAIAVAVLFLALVAGLKYAESSELIGPDIAKRTTQVIVGLMLAAYANLMPKDIGRWRTSALAAARSQSALRVGGWSMTLAGLAYAGLGGRACFPQFIHRTSAPPCRRQVPGSPVVTSS